MSGARSPPRCRPWCSGRTLQGLVKALDEIEEVRKEFYSDLRVVGQADDLNTELEKALRLEAG